jgi:UDP-glucose:glycoprotein glucosyltransferase
MQLAMGYVPEDVSTFFYDLPGVPSRRSKLIVPGAQESKLRVFNVQDVFADDVTGRLGSEFVYTGASSSCDFVRRGWTLELISR